MPAVCLGLWRIASPPYARRQAPSAKRQAPSVRNPPAKASAWRPISGSARGPPHIRPLAGRGRDSAVWFYGLGNNTQNPSIDYSSELWLGYLMTGSGVTPSDLAEEFAPLPYFPFDERPAHYSLDVEECATAIHLAQAHLPKAAELLRTPLHRLHRAIRHSPRLQRVLEETAGVIVSRAYAKYIEALDDPDFRRQEWGATRIMQSRAAANHLFAPAPAPSATTTTNVAIGSRDIVFRWKAPDDVKVIDGEVLSAEGNTHGPRSPQFEDPSTG
jgi:hypothetical protein